MRAITSILPVNVSHLESWRIKFPCLVIAMLCGIGSAQSNVTIWESRASGYTEEGTPFQCNSCHSDTETLTLTMDTPDEVPYDAETIQLSLQGVRNGPDFSRWWYQSSENQGEKLSNISNATSRTIGFSTGNSQIIVRSCLLDADGADRRWNCESQTITRQDPPSNEPPEITSSTPDELNRVKNSDPYEFTVTATDDTSTPIITVESLKPTVVSVDSSNAPTYSLSFKEVGDARIVITARDGQGLESDETIDVTVTPSVVDNPPVFTSTNPGNQTLKLGEPGFTFTVMATAEEGTPELNVRSARPAIVRVDTTVPGTYTLTPRREGSSRITITATDSKDVTAEQTFDVKVIDDDTGEPPNQPPVPAFDDDISEAIALKVGDSIIFGVSIEDENPESLTFKTSSSKSTVATGSFASPDTLTISAIAEGSATISLTVTDEGMQSASISVDVLVTSDNTRPEAKADEFVITAQNAIVVLDVLANDSDDDNDPLSIVLDSANSSQGNALSVSNNRVSYQVGGLLSTEDVFGYKAKDPSGALSDSATVTLIPSDEDDDGIVDVSDNCPALANPDQADMDSDSIGDLCDEDPDGDGRPGVSGMAFESGRELVEEKCLTCHLTGTAGAPVFQDDAAWEARIQAAGGQPEDMLGSVLNGKGTMPGFANQNSTQELLQAILYLSGRENTETGDLDLDGVADGLDNCPNVPNPDQLDSDSVGPGDACEPLADRDSDGYPYSLDDDDGNANRLIAMLPVATNSTVFASATPMRLGRVATAVAQSANYAQAAVVLSDFQFAQGVSEVFPGVSVASDSQFSSLMGVINLDIQSLSGESQVVVELGSNLPLNPVMRIFDTNSGLWGDFSDGGTAGQLASAPATSSGCPNSTSANYRSGLIAGLACLRVNVKDGGVNDADGSSNGQAELIVNITRGRVEQAGVTPAAVNTSPSKSSGGSTSPWIFILLLLTGLFPHARKMPRGH